jgi:hypothetical protein
VDALDLNGKLDRLLSLRGDPATGLGPAPWAELLAAIPKEQLLTAAITAVRQLLVPDWEISRKSDRRPQIALESAEAWLAERSASNIEKVKAAAKACTEARGERFGNDHRVPEAARGVAWSVTAKDLTPIFETLATIEEELLARIALTSEYHRGPEQRRALVDTVRAVLVPKESVKLAAAISAADLPPVPYSPEGHFLLGQRLTHKKFGAVAVTSVGETWIEVELSDASKKRLAHKP